jgi:long-chain acyl-CoA synthetase
VKNPVEHLYFRARCQPDSVAIQRLDGAMTWRHMLKLVRGMAFKLREAGARPGQMAITCLPNAQTDWLLNLALMHEGLVTCSYYGYASVPSVLGFDWVISDRILQENCGARLLVVDGSWMAEAPSVPEDFSMASFSGSDALFRLVLTSGTTGRRKAVPISLGEMRMRAMATTTLWDIGATEFSLFALSTSPGFNIAMRKLLHGMPLYHATSARDAVLLIHRHNVACLAGSPVQIANLVEEAQKLSLRTTSLRWIWYGGGIASPNLISRIRSTLCPNVINWYAATETGGGATLLSHCSGQVAEVGFVLPEVEIEIVDAQHQPLPVGEEGAIRIRTPYMAKEYFRNPEETARSFREGWFYPGDRGFLASNGMLTLAGRDSELINRGGVKVDPAVVDRIVQDYEGVSDAATFGFENHLGVEDICTAIVVPEDFDSERLQQHLIATLGKGRAPALLIKVEHIPRNDMGKPMRGELRAHWSSRLKQPGAQ